MNDIDKGLEGVVTRTKKVCAPRRIRMSASAGHTYIRPYGDGKGAHD